jgi:two-component system sensor histidine kinase ChiS
MAVKGVLAYNRFMFALHRCRFAVVLAAALLVSCGSGPEARQGRLDISSWNFETQGAVKLDGQWQFWWGRPLPVSGHDESEASNIRVPGYWNSIDQEAYPALGAATYRLKLTTPRAREPWALAFPDVASAWTLMINGRFVAESGVASTYTGIYRAKVRPRIASFTADGTTYDIELYVVNQSARGGGIRDSVMFGPISLLASQERLTTIDSAFFTGALLVMALFNLVIFFLQRQRGSNLWLAAFSGLIAVRTFFTGPRLILDVWPSLTYSLMVQIEYLAVFGAVTAFALYLKSLFPLWWPSRVLIAFLFYTALFAILVFILPTKTFSEAFVSFYDIPLALASLLFLGIGWWAVRNKHEDGLPLFIGMLLLLAGVLNDMAYQLVPLPEGNIIGKVLFVFLVFNTILLSRQLSRDYTLTQKQSGDLRKLDKLKDDFLARVTHELRTPLHGMVGIIDAFRMGDFGPLSVRQTYHLSLLESSGKRLLAMVNSILDFSQLRKHQPVVDLRPILLKETVDFLLPSFYALLPPGVALVNRVGEELPAALGDEVKFEEVLQHVIQNAIHHTHTGTVTIEAEVHDLQIILIVRDTGEGIPAEKLDQLFSPFHQVADIDTRPTGGLGLGLAVSRQLMQQMGGKLELTSREGEGTTVNIGLPVCPPTKLQYFQAKRLDRTAPWDATQFPTPSAQEREQPGTAPAGAPNILIVDDEPVNLLVLRTFLNKIGYRVIEASSGPQALERLGESVIDLVILDIMMPGMSGYQVCARIRERFTPARLPVLLLTAKNQVDDLLQGYRSGASDFLTKPFQRDELRARMELHLSVSKAARAGMALPRHS